MTMHEENVKTTYRKDVELCELLEEFEVEINFAKTLTDMTAEQLDPYIREYEKYSRSYNWADYDINDYKAILNGIKLQIRNIKDDIDFELSFA